MDYQKVLQMLIQIKLPLKGSVLNGVLQIEAAESEVAWLVMA